MKIVIAIDSFKGSLSTFEAGSAASEGIRNICKDAEIIVSPLADGGEGTVNAIIEARNGKMRTLCVRGPLGDPVQASYGIIEESNTAVLEMASACGLPLIPEDKRNPLFTSTYGFGEMIADAIKVGCRNFIIGIGGSATNDGGIGMLQALGFDLTDKNGSPIAWGAIGLKDLADIKTENRLKTLDDCHFSVACDVTNPLCGNLGCSAVFAPQKGAAAHDIICMDDWLSRYAALTKQKANPLADPSYPGCGAAGGLGFAFLSYLNAELRSGIDLIIEKTGLEAHIKDADIVITGEGRLDGQSSMGKAPVGVAKLAKKYQKPVIAVAGSVTEEAHLTHAYGIDAYFSILKSPCSLNEAMDKHHAYCNLKHTVEQIFRLLQLR